MFPAAQMSIPKPRMTTRAGTPVRRSPGTGRGGKLPTSTTSWTRLSKNASPFPGATRALVTAIVNKAPRARPQTRATRSCLVVRIL